MKRTLITAAMLALIWYGGGTVVHRVSGVDVSGARTEFKMSAVENSSTLLLFAKPSIVSKSVAFDGKPLPNCVSLHAIPNWLRS